MRWKSNGTRLVVVQWRNLGVWQCLSDSVEYRVTTPAQLWAIVYEPLLFILLLSLALAVAVLCLRYAYDTFKLSRTRSSSTEPVHDKPYARLPLEVALNTPILARSLVRGQLELDRLIRGKMTLRPVQYMEHGVLLDGNAVRTRFGFTGVFGSRLDVEHEDGNILNATGSSAVKLEIAPPKAEREVAPVLHVLPKA